VVELPSIYKANWTGTSALREIKWAWVVMIEGPVLLEMYLLLKKNIFLKKVNKVISKIQVLGIIDR